MLCKQWKVPALVGALAALTMGYSGSAVAEEWEESTPYYEDDAWYDISEWFDGNDYNPTDEVFGEWDDETYDAGKIEYDEDNDQPYGLYGNTADWYYDYDYDPYLDYYDIDLSDTVYDYAVGYYDYDDDGAYDSYTTYSDWDGDGVYEDINYFTLDDHSAQSDDQTNQQASQNRQANRNRQRGRQAQDRQQQRSSHRVELTGTVQQTKEVQTRKGKHLVAQLNADQGTVAVDLGSAEDAKQWDVSEGTQLKVQGAKTKVGDKQVVIAQQVQVGEGQMQQVNRSRARIEGTISSTKQVNIRGATHQLVILDLKDKDNQLMVDLGPAQAFEQALKEGDQIKASGVPVKVRDKAALLAYTAEVNGQKISIDRRQEKPQEVARRAQ